MYPEAAYIEAARSFFMVLNDIYESYIIHDLVD